MSICRPDKMEGRGIGRLKIPGKMKENDWINVHTHRPGEGTNVVDPCLGEVKLPEKGRVYFSWGIHPLYIGEEAEGRLAAIEQAAAGGKIVAVGEAGLDRRSPTSMEVQVQWFERQAEIAARYDLPLIIHDVRAIPELITVYKKCLSPRGWILHGFNNRREILEEVLRHGFYISVGRQVMDEQSPIYQLLPEIPDDRLFLETDDSAYFITQVYHQVARRKGIGVEVLQQIVRRNFNRLFRV